MSVTYRYRLSVIEYSVNTWPLQLDVRFCYVFTFFQNPQKNDFLRFFESMRTFSGTLTQVNALFQYCLSGVFFTFICAKSVSNSSKEPSTFVLMRTCICATQMLGQRKNIIK